MLSYLNLTLSTTQTTH